MSAGTLAAIIVSGATGSPLGTIGRVDPDGTDPRLCCGDFTQQVSQSHWSWSRPQYNRRRHTLSARMITSPLKKANVSRRLFF